jgi:hypothetical protein
MLTKFEFGSFTRSNRVGIDVHNTFPSNVEKQNQRIFDVIVSYLRYASIPQLG